jgi:hypothetical protein
VPVLLLVVTLVLATALSYDLDRPLQEPDGYYAHYWHYFLLANVFILWEMWHFCAQDYGVLSIYRVRSGQAGSRDRAFDRAFCAFMAFGVNLPIFAYRVLLVPRVWHNVFLFLPFHADGPGVLEGPATAALAAGTLATAFMVGREWRKPNRSVQKLAYCLLILSYAGFAFFSQSALLASCFIAAYTLHHWVVALGLFSKINVASHRDWSAFLLRFGPPVAATCAWYYFCGHYDLTALFRPPPRQPAVSGAPLLRGVILGVFFWLSYAHFYFDWCYYQFRRKAVRETVGAALAQNV